MSIVWFHEEAKNAIVGGKGVSLCRMWQAGLPVPSGFCVSSEMVDCLDIHQLNSALSDLRSQRLAVRSSAVGEDTAAASFAGIYLTRMNVVGAKQVAEALQEIRRSAATPSAVAYSQRRNVSECSAMAAVVQTFVPAEASGVLCTGRVVAVEASWGLGESVVGGLVTPDRWTLSQDGEVISAKIADKDIAIVGDPNGGTKQIEVDMALRRRACLTTDVLQQLFRLGRKCEELFGAAQDMEWAIESGRIWILQSRPVTIIR